MITTVDTQAQQKMVEDSLTRAFDELHAGVVRKDARKLFEAESTTSLILRMSLTPIYVFWCSR